MFGSGVDVLQRHIDHRIGQCREKRGLRPLELTTPQQLHENDLSESQRHEINP